MKIILAFFLMFCSLLPLTNTATAQWYVGAALTQPESDQGLAFDRPADTDSDDSTDIAWQLFTGYDFSPSFAMELAYSDLGDELTTFNILGRNEKTRMEASAISATLIGRNRVHEGVDFIGRFGLALWEVDLAYTEPGFSSSNSDTDLDLVVGLGFRWQLSGPALLRIEWQQMQNVGDEVKTKTPAGTLLELNGQDINLLAIGLIYRL